MDEYVIRDGKKLRLGYTTGTCAAAAAKAAAWMLLTGKRREQIQIHTPKGLDLNLMVHDIQMNDRQVICAIEKDSGDDPDITRGVYVYASVSLAEDTEEGTAQTAARDSAADRILIDGGIGVGRVTKRGLDQPIGAAAINSVPRQMIRDNVEEVCRLMEYAGRLSVMISVPRGEELAKKTFNPRLGITGGISILGTTGIVEPMSEQALVDTIRVELQQRRAEGKEYVLLTPGNYGADYIREGIGIDPARAVMVSNFIGDAMDICRELGFKGALLVGHIGKLVKIAGGMLNTHSKYGDCRMEILAAYAGACGLPAQEIAEMLNCATCDDAIRLLREAANAAAAGADLTEAVLDRLQRRIAFILDNRVLGEMQTGAILFSKEYGYLCRTEHAGELLKRVQASFASDESSMHTQTV